MSQWESNVPRRTRKELSYYGALPVTFPWEPTHWVDPASGDADSAPGSNSGTSAANKALKFFDAGNDVYAFAIQSLFPEAVSTSRYNSEYLGDVAEAVLGICWIRNQTASLATLLTHASKYVFALKTLLDLGTLDRSENRIALKDFVRANCQYKCQYQGQLHTGAEHKPEGVLANAWPDENERGYLSGLLQHPYTDAPPMPAICDEELSEFVLAGKARSLDENKPKGNERNAQDEPRSSRLEAKKDTATKRSTLRNEERSAAKERAKAAASYKHENRRRARMLEYTPKGSIDRPKHTENKKQRRSDATDALERDSEDHTDTDLLKSDSASDRTLQGIPSIVKLFAIGWFPDHLYNVLYDASMKWDGRVRLELLEAAETFKTAFLMHGGRHEAAWNRNLSDLLSQIREVRSEYADQYEQLSEADTQECMWEWARRYALRPAHLDKPKRAQRSILNHILRKELGSASRMRAVIQRGLQDFDGIRDKEYLITEFIMYLKQIEADAARIRRRDKQRQSELESYPRDAQEHALTDSACKTITRKCKLHSSKTNKARGKGCRADPGKHNVLTRPILLRLKRKHGKRRKSKRVLLIVVAHAK